MLATATEQSTDKLPPQVREAGEKADAILKDMYPKSEEATGETAEPEQETETPEEKPQTDMEKLQHKFDVLQGKYNAEVSGVKTANDSLLQQMLNLQSQNKELNDLIVDMQNKLEGDKPVDEPDLNKVLTQEDIDMLDEEGISPEVQKLILKLTANQSAAATKDIAQDISTLKQNSLATAEDRFWSAIEKNVSDWESINKNQDFVAYMTERIPGTGFTRQAALSAAQKSLDAKRVIEIYNDFKAMKNMPTATKPSLASQVDPVETTPAPVTTTPGKVWTKEAIKKYYNDVTKGVYKNNPDEAKRIEAEIWNANISGNIK